MAGTLKKKKEIIKYKNKNERIIRHNRQKMIIERDQIKDLPFFFLKLFCKLYTTNGKQTKIDQHKLIGLERKKNQR